MSDNGITSGVGVAPATSRRRAANFALWALQAVLVLQFAMAGLAKVGGDAAMVEMFAIISASASGSGTRSGRSNLPVPSGC